MIGLASEHRPGANKQRSPGSATSKQKLDG